MVIPMRIVLFEVEFKKYGNLSIRVEWSNRSFYQKEMSNSEEYYS